MTDRAPIDWEAARADYEAVRLSQGEIARRYGVSRRAVQKHIASEGWQQDVSPQLDRLVAAKVAGVGSGGDPVKRAEALDAEATRRADVIERHKQEWVGHKALLTDAIEKKDFETAKLAKITAEATAIRQAGERKAWGLDKAADGDKPPSGVLFVMEMDPSTAT